MSKQLTYFAALFLAILAAAQTALADPIARMSERTTLEDLAPVDPMTTTTTTTLTTTMTLPTIPRCPSGIAGAETGSQDGYNYWSFDAQQVCGGVGVVWDTAPKFYCFENPYVDITRSGLLDWESMNPGGVIYKYTLDWSDPWGDFAARVIGAGPSYSDACYICGCYRDSGCFAPGVKITMADGSLRKIEDVRAGDMVRNAKTSAAVKVRQVIEGPEGLPLIRFGFEGATVTTSQAHPVLTAAGLKPANELKKGDTIFDAQGNPHHLTILQDLPVEEGQRVINVNLDAASSDTDQRLIVSDGIITGDIVLQGLLKGQKYTRDIGASVNH
jgi:hypothetical protein